MDRHISFIVLLAVFVVVVLLPFGTTGAQEPGDPPLLPGAGDELSVEGILHQGSLRPPIGEEDEDQRLRVVPSSYRNWNFDAVRAQAEQLVGKAVVVAGTVRDSVFVASSIREIEGGITKTITGWLIEPGFGFDDGRPGWRLYTDRDWLVEFAPHIPVDTLRGKRLTVTMRLGLILAFYESRGHVIEPQWNSTEITETPDPSTRTGLLHYGDMTGADAAEWHLFGCDDLRSSRKLDFDLVHRWRQQLDTDERPLPGQAVTLSGRIDDRTGTFKVCGIWILEGGLTRTFEGTLHKPQVGFDDGALGWHLVDANGVAFELDRLPEDLREQAEKLVGKRLRVTVRQSLGRDFFELDGYRVAIDNTVIKWEVVPATDDNGENGEDE